MKKSFVLILVVSLLLSTLGLSASALTFSDLEETHWAYANVQTLVADGTVSGYEDGTFRPSGTVTRAEFVKMLGMSDATRAKDYNDVQSSHWAYTYIMSADFPEDDSNMFYPDIPITRGLVAELLWNRGGQIADAYAPVVITSQYAKEPKAIAWVYATGLMQGDDGVNLRLDDTLTRAEAATLIIRSRSTKEANIAFTDVVSPKIMENVYNGLNLFDGKEYDPKATITNGEMARAALRIGSEETTLTYYNLNVFPAFEHPYAKELSVICSTCLGSGKNTIEFADQKATFGDSVATLVYQYIRKAKVAVSYGDKTEGLPEGTSDMANVCLTFAKNNGIITLKEDLTAPITLEEFTAVCLNLDRVIGSQTDIFSTLNQITGKYVKKDHSLLLTEVPYGDFRVILDDMPAVVYEKPFVTAVSAPVESYSFAREYNSFFLSVLQSLKDSVKERTGADILLTYYPSLVCNNGNGYTMRLACEITQMSEPKAFNDLFVVADGMADADMQIEDGSVIYFDLAIGENFKTMYTTDEKAYVEQIVLLK